MGFADEVKGRAEALGDKASDALDTARDTAENAWDAVSDRAEEVIDVVKDKATGLVGSVKERFDTGAEPVAAQGPVEDYAAAGPVPEDVEDRGAVLDEAAAETERHSQPGQL
jgi:uncharacterized protein YjbJ (UPF0337 family)